MPRRVFDALLVCLAIVTVWRLVPTVDRASADRPFSLDPPPPQIGSRLTGPGVIAERRGIVLGVSEACPVCKNSLGLYRALSTFALENSEWELLVLGDQNHDWLREAGVYARPVEGAHHISVWATPTLMIVNDDGVITDLVIGFVTASLESRLWDRLDGDSVAPHLVNFVYPPRVALSQFESNAPWSAFQVVDFRSRRLETAIHPRAIQIPLNELSRHGVDVLPRTTPVLLDCSPPGLSEAECLVAAFAFNQAGFERLAMLTRDDARRQ